MGGAVTRSHSHPYMAGLYVSGKQFCGGSLVSPRYVLTAAHCVAQLSSSQARALLVRLGRHHVYHSLPGEVTRRVVNISVHEKFRPAPYFYNDISVLRLNDDVPYSSTIQPVRLAGASARLVGNTALVLGWGRTSDGGPRSPLLREVEVEIWSDRRCREAYSGVANIRPGMVCAGSPNKDSCTGDSGGPLLVGGIQVGLSSWGVGCAEPHYPGVYTRQGIGLYII